MGGGWRYPTPVAPAPLPSQRRATITIAAAIEATVDLLERLPEQRVTIEAIRRRSGVSQGSLTHHFGTRDALIAAAHVERYVRTCARDEAFLRTHGFASPTVAAEHFLDSLITILTAMASAERHHLRWMRMSSIAAAFGDDDLTSTLSDAYTSLTTKLAAIVESAQRSGIADPDVDARTIALVMTTHARGLVLDDLAGVDEPASAWRHLQARLFSTFLGPQTRTELERREVERFGDLWRAEAFGSPGRVPATVAERLTVLRERAIQEDGPAVAASDDRVVPVRTLLEIAERPADHARTRPGRPSAPVRTKVLDLAVQQLRTGGVRAIALEALRRAADMSPQSFNRLVGDREAIVRRARIMIEVDRASRGLGLLTTAIDASPDAAAFRRALEAHAARLTEDGPRRALWQRFETLAATRSDDELRASLARLQRAARDLLVEQVCRAQARGLVDASLPAREVARFIDGIAFWPVFHALDRERPSAEAWAGTVHSVMAMLSPDGPPEPVTPR